MSKVRKIGETWMSEPTIEGAGVHLNRGFAEPVKLDPFLLFDDFSSDVPEYYIQGFPWHPHRGIETITYVTRGEVEHGDSRGNKGVISSGDTQWMTAGSGIVHQEMPRGDKGGRLEGFQLWANLPKSKKMMEPRYRDIKAGQVPEVSLENGVKVKVICGRVGKSEGPVKGVIIDPEYLDVTIPSGSQFVHPTKGGHTVFAYIIEGQGYFDALKEALLGNRTVCLYSDGEQISVTTAEGPVRFLLISGKPIGEPVAWRGPIVMNTQEELKTAFEEYRNDTFIKHEKQSAK
jgi:quercetin 2,3-dioxygenase